MIIIITVMHSERKKFNYNVGSSLYGYSRGSEAPLRERRSENAPDSAVKSEVQNKKIAELENANRALVDETARQFQRFEQDIMRVETILDQKQKRVLELETTLKNSKEDQGALIEALNQKEAIIQQLQQKLNELLFRDIPVVSRPSEYQQTQTPEDPQESQIISVGTDAGSQTEEGDNELAVKYEKSMERAERLEQELCQLKNELFAANSQLSLVQQQFSTFKVLHEIQLAKGSLE